MTSKLVVLVCVAVVVGFLWVRNCTGLDPVVTDVRLVEPRAEATPYRIEATVRNRGQGSGQGEVLFRLRDRTSGRTVQESQKLTLEYGETALIAADIQAPRGSYQPEVEVSYPPQ